MSTPPTLTVTDLGNSRHASAWLALLEHYARDPMGGGSGLTPFARQHLVERLRSRSDFIGLLAWRGDAAVGLLNGFEGFSTFAARPLLNIHDIVVLQSERGRGIGQALLGAIEALARERDCCKLTLEVLGNNQRALKSYRQFGFASYQLDPAAGPASFLEKRL